MNVFYAGALFITTLRIDSSSISAYQASVRPIRFQHMFLSTWFKGEGQVVECGDTCRANAGNAEL